MFGFPLPGAAPLREPFPVWRPDLPAPREAFENRDGVHPVRACLLEIARRCFDQYLRQ